MAIEEILKSTSRNVSTTPAPVDNPNVFLDVLASPFRGAEGALQGVYDLADFATGDDLLPDYNHRFLGRSQTFAGGLSEGVFQFLTGFVPIAGQASKIGALTKVGKAGKKALNLKGYAAAGAVADFTVFQAQEERLSNLIQSFPSLENPITEYFAADDDDGEIEGRFKNSIEGLALGGLADGLFAVVKGIKRGRKGDNPTEIIEDMENTLFSARRDQEFLKDELTNKTEEFQNVVNQKFGSLENAPKNAYDMLVAVRESYQGELAPLFDALIQFAPKTLQDAKFEFNKIGDGRAAQYALGEHKITMNKGGYNTFAHELLHAVTSKEIDVQLRQALEKDVDIRPESGTASSFASNSKELVDALSANSASPLAGLFRSYKAVVEKLGKEAEVFDRADSLSQTSIYGLSNIDEFITEAFTNPEFRRMLSKIPSDGNASKSMFDEFLDAIKKMLGLSDTQTSILDDVMRDTEGVVRQQEAAFEAKFDFLKDSDNILGQRSSRTLDERGDNTVPEGQKAPISEMQSDNMIPTRTSTLAPFQIDFGIPFRGLDISNVPDAYLQKSLTFDSLSEGVKNRISLELDARKSGTAQYSEPTLKQLEKQEENAKPAKQRKKEAGQVKYVSGVKAVNNAELNGQGVSVLRKEGEFHFGNPFSHLSSQTRDTIQTKNLSETVENYRKWLEGTDFKDVKQERRSWVLEQIDSGALDGKKLLYYSKTKPNHAEVLADFIKQRRRIEPITPVTRTARTENILRGEAETPEQLYENYLKSRNETGGKASPARMSFKQYMESMEIDDVRRGFTKKQNPRIQGKSQQSSNFIRQQQGLLGQRGFYSNLSKAADEIFIRHMDDTKGLANKNEELSFERLKKLLIKQGDAGTKEELEFRGFDAYFKGAKDKEKISRAEFEEFLNDSQFDFEFEAVNGLTTREAKRLEEAEAEGEEARIIADIVTKAQRRIASVNDKNYKQKGSFANAQNYALRDRSDFFGESPTQDLNKELGSGAYAHFGDDVIYHVRTTDRDLDGKHVLYVEEIQSDLHTAFRRQSFTQYKRNLESEKNPSKALEKLLDDPKRLREMYDRLFKKADESSVPFIQNGFHNNAARQLLKMAAEKGYEAVWLPSGEQIQQLYGRRFKYGFYDTTYRNALEKAAKNLDPKYRRLNAKKGKKAQKSETPTREINEEEQAEFDNLPDELNPFLEGADVTRAFEGGRGIEITDTMRAKAQEDMPIFGQRDIDDAIENSIDRLANDLETGGDQAILNAAKGIRSSQQAVAIVQAIARNLLKAPTKETLSAEELTAETAEVVEILGGNKGSYAQTIRQIEQAGLGLSDYRNTQTAIYKLIDIMSSNVVDLANQAKEARVNPNLNKQALEVELLSTLDQLHEVQRIWSVMGREAAQTLVQRKFLLNPDKIYRTRKGIGFDSKAASPQDYAKYTNEARTGSASAEKVVDLLAGAKNAKDAKSRIRKTREINEETMGSKAMDVVMEYWMNSLLSGPTTQVVNLLGNSITLAIRTIEQVTGSLLSGDPKLALATLKYVFDMESMREASKIAALTFKDQEAALTQGSRQFDDRLQETRAIGSDKQGALATVINALGTVVNIPSRALLTGDEFFKQLNYRSFVRTQLAYEAMKKGAKNGNEIAKYVQENFDNFITKGARAYNEKSLYLDAVKAANAKGLVAGQEMDEFVEQYLKDNPFDETRSSLADAALGFAEENTFTKNLGNDTVIGTLSNTLNTLKNKGGFWRTLNFVIPFLRTPTNILQFSLDRTPFGTATSLALTSRRKQLIEELTGDDAVLKAQARGKLASAAAVTATALYYVSANKEFITGGGPPNRDELESLRLSGWKPYSIKIGDTYASYQRLDPLATIIGLFADIVEGAEYHDLENIVSQDMLAITIMSLTENITNKSYVKGLDTIVDLVRDPVGNFGPFAGNIAGGFAPTLLTQAQNMADERMLRETRTIFDYFLKKVPVAEATLPYSRNFLGEIRKNQNSPYMTGIANPIYFSKESKDPVDQELASLSHGFSSAPTKLHNAIELRDVYNEDGRQAYDRLMELSGTVKIGGRTLRQQLNKLVKSKIYQGMSKEEKEELGMKSPRVKQVQKIVRNYRRAARVQMLKEFPELQDSIRKLQQDRVQYRLIQ